MSAKLEDVFQEIERASLPGFMEQTLSVDTHDILGDTLLHVVAIWGIVDYARALLDAGAVIDVQGEMGCTPLHEAIGQEHYDMVAFLLSRGADPTIKSEFGDAFQIAAHPNTEEGIRIRNLLNAKEA